ncbi:MAG: anti-sigma-K factor RskA [Qipengyuania sp.]|jgi:anti-sigma-K factor RskA
MTGDQTLAAEYALGLLEGEDLLAARARVASDALFAAEVDQWHERLARWPTTSPRACRARRCGNGSKPNCPAIPAAPKWFRCAAACAAGNWRAG